MFNKQLQKSLDGETPIKTFTPFGCLVALHIYEQKQTQGGLILPPTGRGKAPMTDAVRGLVIAVGPECKQVKIGDVVLICQAVTGDDCLHRGQKTWLCREDHLAGVEDSLVSDSQDASSKTAARSLYEPDATRD